MIHMQLQFENMDEVTKINLDFGNAMLLYAKSALHASWSVDMAMRNVLPAILSRQYIIMKDVNGTPLAYISWCWFDLRREALYLDNPHSIKFEDWKCGDRLWFIDLISPIDKGITGELLSIMKRDIFPNAVARSLRVKVGDTVARIKSHTGDDVPPKERRLILSKYCLELEAYLDGKQNKIKF